MHIGWPDSTGGARLPTGDVGKRELVGPLFGGRHNWVEWPVNATSSPTWRTVTFLGSRRVNLGGTVKAGYSTVRPPPEPTSRYCSGAHARRHLRFSAEREWRTRRFRSEGGSSAPPPCWYVVRHRRRQGLGTKTAKPAPHKLINLRWAFSFAEWCCRMLCASTRVQPRVSISTPLKKVNATRPSTSFVATHPMLRPSPPLRD